MIFYSTYDKVYTFSDNKKQSSLKTTVLLYQNTGGGFDKLFNLQVYIQLNCF